MMTDHAWAGGWRRGRNGVLLPAAPRPTDEPLRTRRRIPACGTESGRKRHRRLGEPVCDDCKAARRVRRAS